MIAYLDEGAVLGSVTPAEAVQVIQASLRGGLDPAADPPRHMLSLAHGQLLMMPSTSSSATGVKLVTLAPTNAGRGLATIQGTYVLFDHETLAPVAMLDAGALTSLRTPAVSVAAVAAVLAARVGTVRVVAFGAGPQAVGHVRTLRSVLGDRVEHVAYVVRSPGRVDASAVGTDEVVASDDLRLGLLGRADVIVCATTAREPLFAARSVAAGAVVIAVGSHEPSSRELDGALLGAAQVVVEDVDTALRECGDVIQAIDEGRLTRDQLIPMRQVVDSSRPLDPSRTVVFKGSGMSWQDLVVAEAVVEASERMRSIQI